MRPALAEVGSMPIAPSRGRQANARTLYFALLGEGGEARGEIDELTQSASRSFLLDRLRESRLLEHAAPTDARSLANWLDQQRHETSLAYREYLDLRKAGGPRRFFTTRSHALFMLRSVAPTKMVDGAWLYGLTGRWKDARLEPLIRIYLEELGDGIPSRHHVLLYRKLLATQGCEGWQQLSAEHFTQGAIQLALAHHADEFLPEVIGFNLGYEQLPLHLLITAYELKELGIDPHYFTLHVTVDNASTGHAQQSIQCALDCLSGAASSDFSRRLMDGFGLNSIGMGTVEAIASFDLEQELLAMLRSKARIGAMLHSDRCRIGGRTVTQWLTAPGELSQFLDAMQTGGWIKRGAEPSQSRFWRLLHDPQGPMFGVFTAYEKQLLSDWIRADDTGVSVVARPRPAQPADAALTSGSPALRLHLAALESQSDARGDGTDDDDCRQLEHSLAETSSKGQAMSLLQGYLSPANHATPAGLLATRLYAALLAGRV